MKYAKQLSRKQSGFTLVEIAIVLVIIGLLLGGVLKGQEMIEGARIKSVVGDMNGVATAYNTYQDRFRSIPGDELAATMTARGWAGTVGGNGNGVLAILPTATFTNNGEQASLWRALRASGLAVGDPASAATQANLPRAGTGGLLGVSVGAYGLTGPTVCVSGLTAKQAAGIDVAVDGVVTTAGAFGNNQGSIRADTGAANPLQPVAAAPTGKAFDESVTTLWTVCRKL